jgi:hypothetical protein
MGILKTFFRSKEQPQQAVRRKAPESSLCLYIIGFEDPAFHGIVKIGVTKDLKKRLATLQTGCPWRLEVKSIVFRSDSFQYEDWLHKHFDQYRMREDGEWFQWPQGRDPVADIKRA